MTTSVAPKSFSGEWLSVLQRVAAKQAAVENDGGILWFRGHADTTWTLTPSLHRYMSELEKAVGVDVFDDPTPMAEEHKTHYRKFVTEAWPLLQSDERLLWGRLFAMQHFGHPTRLLDWSESFACALYFAQQRQPTSTAAIYMLLPEILNERVVGTRGLIGLEDTLTYDGMISAHNFHPHFQHKPEWRSLAVQVALVNDRMMAQKSRFVICGDYRRPLDVIYPEVVEKIELSPSTFGDAQRFLKMAGIDSFTLFPDHEGLGLQRREALAKYKALLANYQPAKGRPSQKS